MDRLIDYKRTYITPIFHIEKANTEQFRTMKKVFDTLKNCGIDFCVVQQKENSLDELIVMSYGNFTSMEKKEIITEVAKMYINDKRFNYISMR
jgi:hypothetical protein